MEASASQLDTIRRQLPGANDIKSLGSGDINDVVLVNDDTVFRFPKNEQGRQNLHFEVVLLTELQGKTTLQIPAVLKTEPDYSSASFTFVPGNVLKNSDIKAFSSEHKESFASGIAGFVIELNRAINVDRITELRRTYIPWFQDENTYYRSRLHDNAPEHLKKLYTEYYEKYEHKRQALGAYGRMVIFGDLHAGNLLFNSDKLNGIIDFGDCGPGGLHNELRQLYSLGEDIVCLVINRLNDEFGPCDVELVRLNAVMHEIAVLMRPESQPPQQNLRADISRRLLSEWLGEAWEQA